MRTKIRKEEYTALGDFILPSFERDQAVIAAKFPKLDTAFLNAFIEKLTFVKKLESSVVVTDEQKNVTVSLYKTATELNNELTVLNSYIADAGLDTSIITKLKRDLFIHNIEAAILKVEAVEQFVTKHQAELEAEGMPTDFATTLDGYKVELEAKNRLQNEYMNRLKKLTEINVGEYNALYVFISKIANKGKIIFKDTVTQDEYTISKNISRMRAAKLKKDDKKDAA